MIDLRSRTDRATLLIFVLSILNLQCNYIFKYKNTLQQFSVESKTYGNRRIPKKFHKMRGRVFKLERLERQADFF